MKKLYSLIIIVLLSIFIPAFASEIDIQPAMSSKSDVQDRVWVGTFQIVWNEFIDKYVHTSVRFREGTPVSVKELNLKLFTISDLTEKCYYKFSGNIKKNTKHEITKAISKKFNEKSDILDSLDLTPNKNNFLIYAMLKKDFEFLKEFDKLGKSKFGNNMTAEYFGINNNTNSDIKNNVKVLFYNNQNDYAVKLITNSVDEVFLYKSSANKDFRSLYKDMDTKTNSYKGKKLLQDKDEMKPQVL